MKNYNIKNEETAIMKFRGENLFLSNFYEGKVFTYRGHKFTNSEAAFHAEKCWERVDEFELERPSQSKRLGRKVKMREDWEDVKDKIMYDICYAKFTQDRNLLEKLLQTEGRELVEGNTHGDRCWGMTYSQKYKMWIGENRLGIVLMKLREDLKGGIYNE